MQRDIPVDAMVQQILYYFGVLIVELYKLKMTFPALIVKAVAVF